MLENDYGSNCTIPTIIHLGKGESELQGFASTASDYLGQKLVRKGK